VSRLAPAAVPERIVADIDALAGFRDPAAPGWTRPVFSPEYRAGKDWVAGRMRDAGLAVAEDAACNLVGTLPGAGVGGRALVTGSHTDTVQGGGRFDGIVGVLAAIEAVRVLRDAGLELTHEVRVVDFTGEEPNDFGLSCVGSRAIAGELAAEHLALTDETGTTLGQALAGMGGDPDAALAASWDPDDVAAFVELHIEQGPILERRGVPLGVVTGIAGIHRVVTTFTGQADHAGTTPMELRRDALCAAAETIVGIERAAGEGGGVATTGRIHTEPGASNVVPGTSCMWTEFRSPDLAWLRDLRATIDEVAGRAARERHLQVEVEDVSSEDPVGIDHRVRAAIAAGVDRLGLDALELPSGAGHDAVFMAQLAPIGMIFVPSRDGRSHCPEEWTDAEHVAVGARVLAQSLLELDTRSPDKEQP